MTYFVKRVMLSLVHLSGSQASVILMLNLSQILWDVFVMLGLRGYALVWISAIVRKNCTRSRRMASPKLIMPFFRHNVSIFCKENMQLESITSQKSNYSCMTLPLHCFPVCV